MKLALRCIIKILNAASSAIEELRYESGIYKSQMHDVNKQVLSAKSTLQAIVEEL